MATLSDIGEDALIDWLTAGLEFGTEVVAGPGDDCAVLESPDESRFDLLKTDCLVEGVHFEPATDPEAVGWKALCRVLSDVAAMGGTPRHALITLVVPGNRQVEQVEGWYRGIRKAAEKFGVDLVGGETSSLPDDQGASVISVMLTGTVKRSNCVFRSSAGIGDRIAVTGKLGGAVKSGRHLDFLPRLKEGRWLGHRGGAVTAMMDLSDGLARDLPRLARISGTGYRIDFDAIPQNEGENLESALGEGEDYELLLTLKADAAQAILEDWADAFPSLPLTEIGEITESVETPLEGGWDHFARSEAS